jgi:N-carbamoyl-L-amino-acid hydrolase
LQQVLDEYGTGNSRATIGKLELFPGAANVIPGKARFTLEVRDTDSAILRQLADAYRRTLAVIARKQHLVSSIGVLSELAPTPCSPALVATLREQADALGLPYHLMPSGAAHDCQMLAKVTPAGMIFVPSKGGKSHSAHEWTAFKDIEAGTNLLLNTLISLASRP